MEKLRRLWGKETSSAANQHVVPLKADAEANQDFVEARLIDVRARNTDFQDSPASSTAHLDTKGREEPPSPPAMMQDLLPRQVDIQSAPRSLPQTPSTSTSSISVAIKRSPSSQISRSDQKGAAKSNTSIDKQVNGRQPVASRRSNPATAKSRTKTVWSSDDMFLPRAKPPPPLITKHNRNGFSAIPPSPPPKHRPSTSHQTSSHGQLSKQLQRDPLPSTSALHPPRPRVYRLFASHSNVSIVDAPPASTDINRKPSIASMGSKFSDNSFVLENSASAWKWTPPASWAGPPGAVASVNHHEGDKRSGLVRVNSAKGSLNRHVHARPNLPSQNIGRPQLPRPTEIGMPEEASVNEDVIVKVQDAETDEWHESAIADVIPHLRALKA